MKKKIIILGVVILLVGIVAPQSGAVEKFVDQKDVVQAPLEEETYTYAMALINLDKIMDDITFEAIGPTISLFANELYFNVKMSATATDWSYFEPIFLYIIRTVHLDEGDFISVECPVFLRVLPVGPSAPPPEEAEVGGFAYLAKITVIRAAEK